jgi:hypothetical protein
MRAAQNSVHPIVDVVMALPSGVADLVLILPPWLRATVVVVVLLLVVARVCVPPLLRELDDHLFARKARRGITEPEDLLEVLRIRHEPRRLFGLRGATAPPSAVSGQPAPPASEVPQDAPGSDPP